MYETINEYGRTIIVCIMFAIVCNLIFGGSYFKQLGKACEIPQEKVYTTGAVAEVDSRKTPTFTFENKEYAVGTINLKNLVRAYDENGNDISDRIIVKGQETRTFGAGNYEIEYSVTDTFDRTTRVIYTLRVK